MKRPAYPWWFLVIGLLGGLVVAVIRGCRGG